MEPVRIKYYGLIWMTRRTYLLTTLVLGIIFVGFVLLFAFTAAEQPLPFHWPWDPMPASVRPGFSGWFFHHFWTIVIVTCLAELVDILVTLHKFAQKEAEQALDEESL